MRDNRLQRVGDVTLLYDEIRACEECCNSSTQEQRTKDSIDDKACLECAYTKDITSFVLEFIADSLYNKGEKDQQPNPISASEAGTIEQWEGCKECSTEGNKRGKGEFPLTSR